MRLPGLPQKIMHNEVDTAQFLGLNLTNNTRDGEFKDTSGISSSRFPFMSQIAQRIPQETYENPTDVFVWNGDMFVIDGDKLKRNGEVICSVIPGEKQMAVINTKLVIFPDKIYIDITNNERHSLHNKDYSIDSYTFTENTLTAAGLGTMLEVDDTVEISGGLSGHRMVVHEVEDDTVTFLEPGLSGSGEEGIRIVSSVPDLDFICSSSNRIWGCNIEENTIYSSALGDPTNFFDYGTNLNAYSVAVGSDGDFTGICAYAGSVMVWKEHMLHKMMGTYPAEYYLVDYQIYGVQAGSEKSLITINNMLYYKGVHGVYKYGGNTPSLISHNLTGQIFSGAAAGTDGQKYYISMADEEGEYHLFAFDLTYGLWLNEEDIEAKKLVNIGSDLYYLRDNVIYKVGSEVDPELKWHAEFVPYTENTFARKGYSKLMFRMDMEPESEMTIRVKLDRGEFKRVWHQRATRRMTVTVPVRLGRCDRYTLRIEGKGEVLIRAAGRDFVTGSGVN